MIGASKFTIHFATINTETATTSTTTYYEFTIHFATINTEHIRNKIYNNFNLQYTLLLLILQF